MMKELIIMVFSFVTIYVYPQGNIEFSYTPSRNFMDEEENKAGTGDMLQLKGRYTFPFHTKKTIKGQMRTWSGTFSGMYALMDNKGMATEINPDKVLNLNFSVSHLRPISKKWYMVASIGTGIYSAPDEISFNSILVNGAFIFVYRLKDNLDVGIGAGLTNSYGVPLIMPMGFLKWSTTGSYEINVEMANSMKLSIAKRFTDKFRIALVPLEMDGISSVIFKNDRHKIYSITRMKAYLRPELRIGKRCSAYMGIGADILNSVKISDRTLKGFVNSFRNDGKWMFKRTFFLTAGLKYGF